MINKNLIKVDIEKIMFYPPSKGYAVILKESGGHRQLPIIIGVYEAQAIALGIEKLKMPRPMTHDLFVNFIEKNSYSVQDVMITNLLDGTYYANIVFKKSNGELLKLDSRPSDAIAIGLRMNCNIYVAENVLIDSNQIINKTSKPKQTTQPENLNKIFQLQVKMQDAIDRENYELAAKLRDEINIL